MIIPLKSLMTASLTITGLIAIYAAGFHWRWIHAIMGGVLLLGLVVTIMGSLKECAEEEGVRRKYLNERN